MTTPNAAYLSAISLMLAAYGFFYNLYRERIDAGLEAGPPKQARNAVEDQIEAVKKARNISAVLALVALVAWLIFLDPVVEEIDAAFRLDFSFAHYSAIDTAFVVVATAWLAIFLIVAFNAIKLTIAHGKLKDKLATL